MVVTFLRKLLEQRCETSFCHYFPRFVSKLVLHGSRIVFQGANTLRRAGPLLPADSVSLLSRAPEALTPLIGAAQELCHPVLTEDAAIQTDRTTRMCCPMQSPLLVCSQQQPLQYLRAFCKAVRKQKLTTSPWDGK